MRQTLFYLPTELFGLPLFGKGLLFWAILIAGIAAVVRFAFKKRADDAWFYGILTAGGLFVVDVIGPRIAESGGFPIRGYGVFLTLAILISTILTIWRAKRRWNYPPDAILSIVFVAAFFGIVGARVFYITEYWEQIRCATWRETLISAVDLTSGGLVVYGSIIGGIVATVIFLKVKKLPALATLDLFAPALALGVAIGRIGCLMNGCCFGGPCDLPWAIQFPPGSPAHSLQMEEGLASLYGITLAEPEIALKSLNAERADAQNGERPGTRSGEPSDDGASNADSSSQTLFSIKSKHKNLASDVLAPPTVAAVDPGSEAEKAGIVPGARIVEVGVVPKGFLATDAGSRRNEIRRFRPENNAQVFYFFSNIWADDPASDVWLVVRDPKSRDAAAPNAFGETADGSVAQSAAQDVGKSAESASASRFREFVFHPAPSRPVPVHPTQLYSSATALCVCVLLLLIAKIVKRDGLVFAWLLILYPTGRFCLELIRTDEESFLGTGLTVSQCVSVVVWTVGAAMLATLLATKPRRALDGYFPTTPETPSETPLHADGGTPNVETPSVGSRKKR